MSVRVRLTLLNMLVFALVLGALGMLIRVQVERTLWSGVDAQLNRRASRFVPRDGKYELAWVVGVRERLQQAREQERKNPKKLTEKEKEERKAREESFRFPFYDLHGWDLLESKHRAMDLVAFDEALKSKKPVYSSTSTHRIYTTFLVATETGEPVFYQTTESLQAINAELNRLTRTLLTLIPFALLLASAGGMFLTGRALAPVREVTDAAGRIGVEDLSERLPVRGKDEFARLEATFNGMLERLEGAFERQRRFVADASHELKTPLTVIKANSSLALSDPDLPTDYRETFLEIDRAADRTSRLVQDLLLLARTDHGQLPLKEAEVAAESLFSGVLAEAKKLYPEGATLQVTVGKESFWGDAHLLHRLLLNLVDNALRHTPREGTVTLVAQPSGFVLSDTGEGIAPEHLAHLGERFYRVDSARARSGGGTGLGLSIARAIVEAHGGTLQITSQPGKGTTVTVTLAPQAH